MAVRRIELGFQGGTVLRLTVEEGVAEGLTEGLAAGHNGRWRAVEAQEGVHWVNQNELIYVRLAPQAPGRVGFGGD